jgi:hypothetical protein
MFTEVYEVTVQVAPSQGGQKRTFRVEASDEGTAILRATRVLDDQEVTRWSLVGRPVKVAS